LHARRNNVGVLRLLFACLVIVGHASEQIDGNRSREPLTRIFHTMSLGEVAVDAFFLLSGYLITMSMIRTGSLRDYLERRVLRIYPAFIVAYMLSVYVLGPVVGAHPWTDGLMPLIRMILLLEPPDFAGQLAGLHYPHLNGPLWTISYEFRCYLLVAALGVTGLLVRRRIVLGATALAALALVAGTFTSVKGALNTLGAHGLVAIAIRVPWSTVHLTTTFLVGVCFYLYRDRIFPALNARFALLCTVVTLVLMYRDPHFAELALITTGAGALFWLAFKANLGPIQKVNNSWDISYGVYLYGWFVANLLRSFDRGISAVALASLSLSISLAFGALSWWGVERPAKEWFRSRSVDSPPRPTPAHHKFAGAASESGRI
jgi:peptidoglycan/LPS O-acetylase OafA/YrhL